MATVCGAKSLFPSYVPSVILIYVLIPGVIVQGASRVAISSITATGARQAPALVGLASGMLAFFYVPFAIAAGALGVAVGSSLLYFVQGVLVFGLYSRAGKLGLRLVAYSNSGKCRSLGLLRPAQPATTPLT